MSNLRRDDCLYGMAWVRVAGPLAVCLYQAAEDYCHRELSGATIPRSELEIALPWPLRAGELDAAIELLIRLDRLHPIEGGFFLPRYFLEQESDEDQKSTRAKQVSAGKSRAATAERDAKGRMKPKPAKFQPVAGSSSQTLDSGSSPPASGPSGPSGPGRAGIPPEGAAAPPRTKSKRDPHPDRQKFLAEFHEAHKTASGGRTYQWTGRERGMLDRYCAEIKFDVWQSACAAYAMRQPEWLFRNGSVPDLGSFYRNLNAFTLAAPGSSKGPVPGGMIDTANRVLENLRRMQSNGVG